MSAGKRAGSEGRAGVDRTRAQRRQHPTEFYRTAPAVALDCSGSAGRRRGRCILDCVSLHAACGIETAGASGGGSGPRRLFKCVGRVRHYSVVRRHAHCLPFPEPSFHAQARPTGRHRATDHGRRDQPVLFPRWSVDRLYRGRKAEKNFRGRWRRDRVVRLPHPLTPAPIGARTAILSRVCASRVDCHEFPPPAALPLRSPSSREKNGRIAGRRSCPAAKRSCSPPKIPLSALMTPILKS